MHVDEHGEHGVRTRTMRETRLTVFQLDRYQSGIDHSLIDLESGMVNWYLRIPLSRLILLSSSGAVYSAVTPASDCSNALENVRIWLETAGNGRRRSDTARKEMVFEVEWLFWGYAGVCRRARGHVKVDQAPFPPPGQSGIEYRSIPLFDCFGCCSVGAFDCLGKASR